MNYAAPSADLKKAKPTRTSALLREFALSLTGERVSIGDIVAALGDRGLGVLIAIFALPNILPSTVPFGNVLTGIPPLVSTLPKGTVEGRILGSAKMEI